MKNTSMLASLITSIVSLGVQGAFDKLSLRSAHFGPFTFVRDAICAVLAARVPPGPRESPGPQSQRWC